MGYNISIYIYIYEIDKYMNIIYIIHKYIYISYIPIVSIPYECFMLGRQIPASMAQLSPFARTVIREAQEAQAAGASLPSTLSDD